MTGRQEQPLRLDVRLGIADDPGKWLEAVPLDGPLADHDRRRATVRDARHVAGGRGPARRVAAILALGQVKGGLESGKGLDRRVPTRALVDADDGLAALGVAHRHRGELGVEPPGVHRRDRVHVTAQRELVLVLAADLPGDGRPLGVGADMALLDGAPQRVVHGRVDDRPVAQAIPETGTGQQYGPPFMLSIPPATTTSASPALIWPRRT